MLTTSNPGIPNISIFCELPCGETTAGHPCNYVERSVALSSESENLIGVELCSMLCSSAFSEYGTEVVSWHAL